MGASVIEKHFKFDKDITVDSKFSMDTNNFKIFKKNVICLVAKGVKFFGSTKSEKSFEKNKRSIFAIKDIEKEKNLLKKISEY